MEDVAGVQTDLQVGVDREVEHGSGLLGLLGAVELDLSAGVVDVFGLVVEVPGPLLGSDFDDLLAGGRVIRRLLHDLDVLEEESEDEDDRSHGEEDFDRHAVAHLHRQTAIMLAAAVGDHGPQHEAPHDEAYDEESDPAAVPQRCIGVRVARRAFRLDGKKSCGDLLFSATR